MASRLSAWRAGLYLLLSRDHGQVIWRQPGLKVRVHSKMLMGGHSTARSSVTRNS